MVFIVYFPITFRPEPLGYVITPIITNGDMAKGFGACVYCDVYHGMDYDITEGFGNHPWIVDQSTGLFLVNRQGKGFGE